MYGPGLKTFIAHVPRAGAEEEDVAQIFDMVTGGNPSHYWEDSGMIGYLYQEVMDIEVYAYDVWMIYRPGIKWEGNSPPIPDYWMHNLWGVSEEEAPRLDSKVFAEKVKDIFNEFSG